MRKRFFVTGTDTEVGKTLMSATLLYLAAQRGLNCLGLKPVAAGCEGTPEGLRNADALLLQQHSTKTLSYEQINPVALKEAIAPHIAATRAGRHLSAERLVGFCRGAMSGDVEFGIVEGAGGWRVPLNARELLSDVPKSLELPVILVVGMRLGCLNHALLTAEAIVRDGLRPCAWIANCIDPNMPVRQENIDTLRHLFPFPLIGIVPHLDNPKVEDAAAYLTLDALL